MIVLVVCCIAILANQNYRTEGKVKLFTSEHNRSIGKGYLATVANQGWTGQAIIVTCMIGISVAMGGVGGPPAEIEFAGSHRIFLESLVGADPDMDIMG
jgi:hypothetical protein